MTWTKGIPKKPGYYWTKLNEKDIRSFPISPLLWRVWKYDGKLHYTQDGPGGSYHDMPVPFLKAAKELSVYRPVKFPSKKGGKRFDRMKFKEGYYALFQSEKEPIVVYASPDWIGKLNRFAVSVNFLYLDQDLTYGSRYGYRPQEGDSIVHGLWVPMEVPK